MFTKLRRVRKMTYVVWAWCLAILAWAIAGGSNAASSCHGTYANYCQAGAGIGIALILFVGFFGFVFFSIIWFMTRPKTS